MMIIVIKLVGVFNKKTSFCNSMLQFTLMRGTQVISYKQTVQGNINIIPC